MGNPTHYYLRLSVTDGCGFRCPYCQPSGPSTAAHRGARLAPAEIRRIVATLAQLGVTRVRLTGGEPLSRPDLRVIIEAVSRIEGIRDVSLTTNGEKMAQEAGKLAKAGLSRVNIHIDSLRSKIYRRLVGRDSLTEVLEGVEAAKKAALEPVKINVVLMRGINDTELIEFCEFAIAHSVSVRFIELMNTGSSGEFVRKYFFSAKQARELISKHYALVPRFEERGASPAREYMLDDGVAVVGFIASETEPFCNACNRLRVTADGRFRVCLYEPDGIDLLALIREKKIGDEELLQTLGSLLPLKRSHHPELGQPGKQAFSMAEIGG